MCKDGRVILFEDEENPLRKSVTFDSLQIAKKSDGVAIALISHKFDNLGQRKKPNVVRQAAASSNNTEELSLVTYTKADNKLRILYKLSRNLNNKFTRAERVNTAYNTGQVNE